MNTIGLLVTISVITTMLFFGTDIKVEHSDVFDQSDHIVIFPKESVRIKLGENMYFSALATDQNNDTIFEIDWIVQGGVGYMTGALFTATHVGKGKIIARTKHAESFVNIEVHKEE